MYQIPWEIYSEPEILEVLTEIFTAKGYKVYNIHKTDRREELGVDIECTKPAENQKVILAVKKQPRKSDVSQLEEFAERPSTSRIYVYINEPSVAFKTVMERLGNHISFWNAETLTYELFCTDLHFYLFMVLENSFEKSIYKIVRSFFDIYFKVEKKKIEQPLKATTDMLNLLWAAKDRSASLNKSLRTLQLLFEEMNLPHVTEEIRKSMVLTFLKNIEHLELENLVQLQSHFSEFLDKYPTNFEQFCKQTKGRSNWLHWANIRPTLSPSFITKSLESERKSSQRMKDFFKGHNVSKIEPPSLSEILGDVARTLANEVDMFEDTVDDLFSISLFGKWDDVRDEFVRMAMERSNELRSAIKKELTTIEEEIDQSLKDKQFQASIFSIKVFTNCEGELKQHLCLNDFLLLQETYSKILALKSPTNLPGVHKRRREEAKTLIEKAIKMLDKNDLWDVIKASKSFC
jgi:hypothetical protein